MGPDLWLGCLLDLRQPRKKTLPSLPLQLSVTLRLCSGQWDLMRPEREMKSWQ